MCTHTRQGAINFNNNKKKPKAAFLCLEQICLYVWDKKR